MNNAQKITPLSSKDELLKICLRAISKDYKTRQLNLDILAKMGRAYAPILRLLKKFIEEPLPLQYISSGNHNQDYIQEVIETFPVDACFESFKYVVENIPIFKNTENVKISITITNRRRDEDFNFLL